MVNPSLASPSAHRRYPVPDPVKSLPPVSPSLSEPDSDLVWWPGLDSEPIDLVSSAAWSLDPMSGCSAVAGPVLTLAARLYPVVQLDPVIKLGSVIWLGPVIWPDPVARPDPVAEVTGL